MPKDLCGGKPYCTSAVHSVVFTLGLDGILLLYKPRQYSFSLNSCPPGHPTLTNFHPVAFTWIILACVPISECTELTTAKVLINCWVTSVQVQAFGTQSGGITSPRTKICLSRTRKWTEKRSLLHPYAMELLLVLCRCFHWSRRGLKCTIQ